LLRPKLLKITVAPQLAQVQETSRYDAHNEGIHTRTQLSDKPDVFDAVERHAPRPVAPENQHLWGETTSSLSSHSLLSLLGIRQIDGRMHSFSVSPPNSVPLSENCFVQTWVRFGCCHREARWGGKANSAPAHRSLRTPPTAAVAVQEYQLAKSRR
jgi:hypothetical protein